MTYDEETSKPTRGRRAGLGFGPFDGCRIPDPLAPPEQAAAAIVPAVSAPKRSGLEITPAEYTELAELLPLLDEPVGSKRGVDARALHGALKVGTRFNDWIGRRLEELGLVERVDFEFYSDASKTPGRPRTEYVVSVTGAKHLAMAEANERGRLVRAYFIAAEKRLRQIAAPAFDPADPRVVLAVLEAQVEKVKALEATNAELAPKAEVYDRIVACDDTLGLREAHKVIRESTGVTERELVATMIRRGWVQRLGKRLAPACYGEAHGYVTSRLTEYTAPDGSQGARQELRVTPKGVARITDVLTAEEAA